MLSVLVVGSVGLLGACGGSDDDATEPTPDNDSDTDTGTTPPDEQATDTDEGDGADPGGSFDPAAVRACLSAAGFETVSSSELLSEQQVEDQLTAFGQTESLTFDASTVAFAGGVSFFETADQAADRGQQLADVAKAQRVVGNALINVGAGTDFDGAVAAAEACLSE